MTSLLLAAAALGYSAVRSGNWGAIDASVAGLLVLCAASMQWARRQTAFSVPRAPGWMRWPLFALAMYVAFQLVPLPVRILGIMSPDRAAVVHAANVALPRPVSFASLSLAPSAGLPAVVVIVTCIVIVFLIRELAWEHGPAKLIAPVITVAAAEALFSLVQCYFLGPGEARGSWANRNHFANYQAMCLPFPVAVAISRWRQGAQGKAGTRWIVLIWLAFCVAVVLVIAITQSLSRMGFTVALLSLSVFTALSVAGKTSQWRSSIQSRVLAVASSLMIVTLAAVVIAPPELVLRFGKVEFSDGIRTEDRLLLWKESRALISAYPAFGTGLGGYESAFLKYKVTFPLVRDAYAHNDYLQYLIELGAVGFSIAMISAAAILFESLRLFRRGRGQDRVIGAACCGAFAAILLHSTVDFSLYNPANALLLAWIVGVACSLGLRHVAAEVIMPGRSHARQLHQEHAAVSPS
jgi:O-antigen ligase